MREHYVLITGASGQLGTELQRCKWPEGWSVVAFDRTVLELTDHAAINATIAAGHEGRKFSAIINCAAYTAVDRAESDQITAWAVNALAPAALAASCASTDIPLVQVSTDYVFSGNKAEAWRPDDHVAPLSVYGSSKLGGELAVRSSGARHAIIRAAWIFSAHGNNFVKTMLRLAQTNETLSIVGDQRGSPTSAADLAAALATIAVRLGSDSSAPTGTFHFSGAGATTWAHFAEEIFRQSARRGGPAASVTPIDTSDYPTPATRPANSVLDLAAIREAYGILPRPWQESLSDVLNELIGTNTCNGD